MTVEESSLAAYHKNRREIQIAQIKEITGVQDKARLTRAIKACQKDGGSFESSDVIHHLLAEEAGTNNAKMAVVPVPVTDASACETSQQAQNQQTGQKQPPNQVIDLTADSDDIQKAISESLKESQGILGGQVTKEEQDISRILEASLEDTKAGTKRKRGELWFVDPLNPHERERVDNWPVGLKNVGNTCWFSAVIQSLFHLPVFRHLVLNFQPLPDISQGPSNSEGRRNLKFMQELRQLFALLVQSKRKYVDPSRAVEILKEAFSSGNSTTTNAQQDVSEFQHKLLEWLEDAFKSDCSRASSPAEGASTATVERESKNPMVQLFYGQVLSEGVHEGSVFSNKETFGQFPLQVEGNKDIHESLELAMAQGEIESLDTHRDTKSGQEQWFTRLPPVLTFELSRFQFNQQLGRPEKIHHELHFPEKLYMDRYMESNKATTRQRREEVRKLSTQLQHLHARLDKFLHYGSGPVSKRVPLQDVLQYALEFAETKPVTTGLVPPSPTISDVEMESPDKSHTKMAVSPSPSSKYHSPASTSMLDHPVASSSSVTPTKKLASRLAEPAPREITREELQVLQTCLHRWRTEVETDVKELQDNINKLEAGVGSMYKGPEMQKFQYRLHAVLVHEGQAASGHYWAYVYKPEMNHWLKFNDITVTDASWEDLEKESRGGYHNASAYCLMYVDANRSQGLTSLVDAETGQSIDVGKLPPDLQQIVDEDNAKFAQEISDWDKEILRKQQSIASGPVPSTSVDPDVTIMSPSEQAASDTLKDTGLTKSASMASLKSKSSIVHLHAETHAKLSSEHTYQAVMNAISEAVKQEKPRTAFITELCQTELRNFQSRADKLQMTQGTTEKNDGRIQHILVYLLANKAPQEVVERVAWEQFIFLDRLDENPRSKMVKHVALQKWEQLKNNASDASNSQYVKWHHDYYNFRQTASEFATAVRYFHEEKYREALPLFDSACDKNIKLVNESMLKGLDKNVLEYYRRQCLLHLNEQAVNQFESSEEVDDILRVMSNQVLPSLMQLSSSPEDPDQAAVEEMRAKWCQMLGSDMPGSKGEKLQDFFTKLFDPPPDIHLDRPHHNEILDTSERLNNLYNEAVELAEAHRYLDNAYLGQDC